MAVRQTNPVLEVLGEGVANLSLEKKYPQPPLDFQQGPWRAFYHCHAVPDSDLQEHGHFHLFTQYQQQWVHVAALSMDAEGQPQAWLAVNRWVSDGPWLAAPELVQHLQSANYAVQDGSVLEVWLLCMLQVFTADIQQLLNERDKVLRQVNTNNSESEILEDRTFYTLAVQTIDLLTTLNRFPNPQAGD